LKIENFLFLTSFSHKKIIMSVLRFLKEGKAVPLWELKRFPMRSCFFKKIPAQSSFYGSPHIRPLRRSDEGTHLDFFPESFSELQDHKRPPLKRRFFVASIFFNFSLSFCILIFTFLIGLEANINKQIPSKFFPYRQLRPAHLKKRPRRRF